MYEIRQHISRLYDLQKDNPTALTRRVDYLLEGDRFMCPEHSLRGLQGPKNSRPAALFAAPSR